MNVRIEESWKKALASEFEKPYFKELTEFVKSEYKSATVYPPPKFLFRAFELCPFDKVKVVILGQDPYHGKGQAHGLSFSVPKGCPLPPSLRNIYKELADDVGRDGDATGANDTGISGAISGNLEHWATQGVLLLNATLTVRAASPGSHQNKGWEQFTDAVIRAVSEKKEHIVFILWGRYARNKKSLIDTTAARHLTLESAHPSPFSANDGFFGSRPFSKANKYLEEHRIAPIWW